MAVHGSNLNSSGNRKTYIMRLYFLFFLNQFLLSLISIALFHWIKCQLNIISIRMCSNVMRVYVCVWKSVFILMNSIYICHVSYYIYQQIESHFTEWRHSFLFLFFFILIFHTIKSSGRIKKHIHLHIWAKLKWKKKKIHQNWSFSLVPRMRINRIQEKMLCRLNFHSLNLD